MVLTALAMNILIQFFIILLLFVCGCGPILLQYLVPKLGKQGIRATTRDGATVIHTAAG